MKHEQRKNFYLAGGLLTAFALWTVAVCFIDVDAIGPRGSTVGFAALNLFAHDLIGVHMTLYTLTDWLSLIPAGFAAGFAWLGLTQWIRRKHLLNVDRSLLVLGGFYVMVTAVYVLFERFVINYRPILIQGHLEASYPSSTTLLVLCVIPTTMMQLRTRIRNHACKRIVLSILSVFLVFMVMGRLISGVHWLTDIIGGILLSAGLVSMYDAITA